MTEFNDIVKKESVLEFPTKIENVNDYIAIIKDAFLLAKDILSFDSFEYKEENDKYLIIVTSKNQTTKFLLDKNNGNIDVDNLIKGLNKALINAFFVGDNKYYDISGSVIFYGVGFISRTQFKLLKKNGFVGAVEKEEVKQESSEVEVKDDVEEKNENLKTVISESSDLDEDLLRQMRKYPNIRIIDIIKRKNENNRLTYQTAKFIQEERNIPIGNIYKDKEDLDRIFKLVDEVYKLMEDNLSNLEIIDILMNNDVDQKTRDIVISKARKKIIKENGSQSKVSFWHIALTIFVIVRLIIKCSK